MNIHVYQFLNIRMNRIWSNVERAAWRLKKQTKKILKKKEVKYSVPLSLNTILGEDAESASVRVSRTETMRYSVKTGIVGAS